MNSNFVGRGRKGDGGGGGEERGPSPLSFFLSFLANKRFPQFLFFSFFLLSRRERRKKEKERGGRGKDVGTATFALPYAKKKEVKCEEKMGKYVMAISLSFQGLLYLRSTF